MSFNRFQRSPFHGGSPGNNHSNNQGRNYNSPVTTANTSLPGWGTPAVGYSPRGNRHGSPYTQYSPRGNNYSNNGHFNNTPRGNSQSQNRQCNNSSRNNNYTPNVSQNRMSSPSDVFKTPQSPMNRSYSSPASYNSFNSSGKRSYNQRFQQNSRPGRNFPPRGSSSIEDYYHISMLEDPWKFTPPVPVKTKS